MHKEISAKKNKNKRKRKMFRWAGLDIRVLPLTPPHVTPQDRKNGGGKKVK